MITLLTAQITSAQTVTPVMQGYNRSLPPVFFGYNGNSISAPNADASPQVFTWESSQLRNAVPQLYSTFFRFPVGGEAKSWDWNSGWFYNVLYQTEPSAPNFNEHASCISYIERIDPPINGNENHIVSAKGGLMNTGASVMLPLNIKSSNRDFQLDLIKNSQRLFHNFLVNNSEIYVEIGNENYGTGDADLLCIYNQPKNYFDEANWYLDKIHTDFPNVKSGVVAASPSVKDVALTSSDSRVAMWNAQAGLPETGLAGDLDHLHLKAGDALIFHLYPKIDIGNGFPTLNSTDDDDMLVVPFLNIRDLKNNEWKTVPPVGKGIGIWITEYNVNPTKKQFFEGTWAQGLLI